MRQNSASDPPVETRNISQSRNLFQDPFSDGNKRTGFLAAYTFLLINGYEIVADQSTIIEFVLAVAAGEIDEEGITAFLGDHTEAFG